MKRYLIAASAALLIPTMAMAGTVYTRAWCKDGVHGRGGSNGAGAYPWISRTFTGSTSDECWDYVRDHESRYGHNAGCSYVTPQGNIN